MDKKQTGIEKCIKQAGGQTELADKIAELTGKPVKQQHVSYWKKAGYVPELYREAVIVAVEYIVSEKELKKHLPLLKTGGFLEQDAQRMRSERDAVVNFLKETK